MTFLYEERSDQNDQTFFVEIVGVEPTTPCLQSRCSSQLSYTPVWFADANMVLFFETDKSFWAFMKYISL